MKLLQLVLNNFKGIRHFVLDTQGGNVDVFGDNATGKTTLFDAFLWLLFDKDSQNKKDFDIKTLDDSGQPYHGLDHEVEAIFDINGKQLTLRKVYAEKWTKKRGSATREFAGHTTDYYIDGVPTGTKKEFVDKVAEIANEDIFKLLTNPSYFNTQLHWQERRKILLEVCGDVSDADVIASDKSLAELPGILQGRKLEDHRKVIVARRAEINKELERIPVRIDEVQRNLPDISTIIPEALVDDMEKLRAERQQKEQELSRIESGGEIAEKRLQLRVVESELVQLKNQHRSQVDEILGEKQRKLSTLKGQIYEFNNAISRLARQKENCLADIARLEDENARSRDYWFVVNERKFEFEQSDTCPTCGQSLPQEKLDAAREKALAKFNLDKATELEAISADGKKNNARIVELQKEVTELDKKIDTVTTDIANTEKLVSDLQKEIDALLASIKNIEETPAYAEKIQQKETLEQAITTLQEDNTEAISKVKQEIKVIDDAIAAIEESIAKVKQHEQGNKRIEELKEQERALASEFERLEQELYLTEQFIRSKVSLLEEKINNCFKLARFKLFETQINGGVVECCETMYQGVPYSSLNNAARINVGLDIINTLSAHYNFTAPIFIDNAEAVTKLIETKGQVINLIVSEADKKLRVEYKTAMKEAV
ncbi:AAA family ATPase [Peptococcaceae bacterium 1198_IL3148]